MVTVDVDDGGPHLEVEEVTIWWSNDDSWLDGHVALDGDGGGVRQQALGFPVLPNTVWYVDVQYRTRDLLRPDRFSISSPPEVPEGLVPHIRGQDDCL